MLLAILFCILKHSASGNPATVTAVDIIDTLCLLTCLSRFVVFNQLVAYRMMYIDIT